MKYIKSIPETDKKLSQELIENGWKQLKSPANMTKAVLSSLPFMLINTIIVMAIMYYLYSPLREFIESASSVDLNINFSISIFYSILYIIVSLLFISLHELIHAFLIPDVFKSEDVYWGINGFQAFVYTTKPIKKIRFLIITIMPFLLLSVVLPFILSVFNLLNPFTIFICLVNAMGSSLDCLNFMLIGVQVPKGAYIKDNGFETYFK